MTDHNNNGAILKLARQLKLTGYALGTVGIVLLIAAPAISRNQAQAKAEQVSLGAGAAGAAFEGVLRGEQYSRGEEAAKSEQTMGMWVLVISALVLGASRSEIVLKGLATLSKPPSSGSA